MFPEEQSKLIYIQLAGSLLPDANRRRTQEEASFIAYRYNMQNVSIYTQPSTHVLNSSTGAAAALFCIHFEWRDPWCSVASGGSWLTQFLDSSRDPKFSLSTSQVADGKGRSQVLRDPSFSHWFGVFPAVLLEM